MALIGTEIEGKLTKKQEQSLRSMEAIVRSFYDERGHKKPRTWAELRNLSKLSAGALSKHLHTLISQGVVERKGMAYVHPSIVRERGAQVHTRIVMKGKAKTPTEICRFYFRNGKRFAQWGYLQRGKRRKRIITERLEDFIRSKYSERFIPCSEIFEI